MNRILFLDKLRIGATCAVVLLHTVTGVMDHTDMSNYPVERTLFLILLDGITWCVPVFILISGYLFLNPEREISFGRMLTKYCRRILFALFLFGVPYACLELLMTGHPLTMKMVVEAVRRVCMGQGWAHMWYLYMILVLYLLTPLLNLILKRIPRWSLYGVLVFLLLGCSILPFLGKMFAREPVFVLPDDGIYLFYYLCGYLFAVTEKKERKGNTTQLIMIFGILVLMMCSRLLVDYRVRMAYNYPFTVALALLLMSYARGERREIKRNVVTGISRICFGVYLIHPVFLNVIYKLLGFSLLDYPIWFSLPGAFSAVLLLSGIVAWVLYQIPMLRKYIL